MKQSTTHRAGLFRWVALRFTIRPLSLQLRRNLRLDLGSRSSPRQASEQLPRSVCSTDLPGARVVNGPRLSISSMSSLVNVSKLTPLSGIMLAVAVFEPLDEEGPRVQIADDAWRGGIGRASSRFDSRPG